MKKINRLLKNQDFKRVIHAKQYYSNQSFTLYKLENDVDHVRIGISINKKFGKAYQRNLAKRQVRMMCQDIFPVELKQDIVLIIKNGYSNLNFEENKNNLIYLFNKSNNEVK